MWTVIFVEEKSQSAHVDDAPSWGPIPIGEPLKQPQNVIEPNI